MFNVAACMALRRRPAPVKSQAIYALKVYAIARSAKF
jgi:hypothetical protein